VQRTKNAFVSKPLKFRSTRLPWLCGVQVIVPSCLYAALYHRPVHDIHATTPLVTCNIHAFTLIVTCKHPCNHTDCKLTSMYSHHHQDTLHHAGTAQAPSKLPKHTTATNTGVRTRCFVAMRPADQQPTVGNKEAGISTWRAQPSSICISGWLRLPQVASAMMPKCHDAHLVATACLCVSLLLPSTTLQETLNPKPKPCCRLPSCRRLLLDVHNHLMQDT